MQKNSRWLIEGGREEVMILTFHCKCGIAIAGSNAIDEFSVAHRIALSILLTDKN